LNGFYASLFLVFFGFLFFFLVPLLVFAPVFLVFLDVFFRLFLGQKTPTPRNAFQAPRTFFGTTPSQRNGYDKPNPFLNLSQRIQKLQKLFLVARHKILLI